MGMAIDTAITVLGMVEAHGICIEAKDIAVDTMRKYQKIAQILDNWKSDGGAFEMSESYWLNQIREVIEDGKID